MPRFFKSSSKHQRLTVILSLFVVFMFLFSYLMVPFFTYVCEKTGINGKNGLVAAKPNNSEVDLTRTIKIEFAATEQGSFKFKFAPMQPNIYVHPGERKTIYFYAENDTGNGITVQAIPSITPIDAARFFKKIECFCFTQQHFKNHEKKEMTLAYTLFDLGNKSDTGVRAKGRMGI